MKQGQFIIPINLNYLVTHSLLMIFLTSCSNSSEAYKEIDLPDIRVLSDPPEIYIKGSVIYYDGKITDNSYSEFLKLVKKSSVNTVSVNSIGGDARNAMLIGDYIYKNRLSVHVRSVCASACANYIFPAAKKKYLDNDSYLLWHGGINGPENEIEITGSISRNNFFSLREIRELKKDDINFYKIIDVNSKISYCPQLSHNYRNKFPEKWFSYYPEDMEKFGIKNINYAISASQWTISMRKNHVIFADYCK